MKARTRLITLALCGAIFAAVQANAQSVSLGDLQVLLADAAPAQDTYAHEARDWGIAPLESIKSTPYHGETPTSVPGASTITTGELVALIKDTSAPPPVLVDVWDRRDHQTIPGAIWGKKAGLAGFNGKKAMKRLEKQLNESTGSDKSRPVVFFCASAQCWLSYNASLRALEKGYQNVNWYRGGMHSWSAAELPTTKVK